MTYRVKGQLQENAPIGAQSWFRCGGHADLLFQPENPDDLAAFLRQYPAAGQITMLGGMANMIIRDGGVRGVCIRLGKPFANVNVMNDVYIEAQAGALNGSVAAAAMKAGIGGLEFLSGIPGSVGGAFSMNAGAYGAEVKDVLVGVTAMTRSGQIKRLSADQFKMGYRKNEFPEWLVILSCLFKGKKEAYQTVKSRLSEIKKKRNETQPIKESTGGSTFANPHMADLRMAGLPPETRAWQIVEMIGGRGYRIGGAQMSEKHCNFMINTGDATASDLEMLGDEMKRRALDKFGVDLLHWEIKRIGENKLT